MSCIYAEYACLGYTSLKLFRSENSVEMSMARMWSGYIGRLEELGLGEQEGWPIRATDWKKELESCLNQSEWGIGPKSRSEDEQQVPQKHLFQMLVQCRNIIICTCCWLEEIVTRSFRDFMSVFQPVQFVSQIVH